MYRVCATTMQRAPTGVSATHSSYPAFRAPARPQFSYAKKHPKSSIEVSEEKLRKKLGETDWTTEQAPDLRIGLARNSEV